MLTILNNLASLRVGRLHRLCVLWKIVRTDSTVLLFTDHPYNIEFLNETYSPTGGFDNTARQKQTGLRARNLDFMGAVTSDKITLADLHAGRFQNATVYSYLVDSRYPFVGSFETLKYTVQNLRYSGEKWEATVVGLTGKLDRPKGFVATRLCNHDLGDAICRIDLGLGTVSSVVDSVNTNRLEIECDLSVEVNPYLAGTPPIGNGHFAYGKLTWTSGANEGLQFDVSEHDNSVPTRDKIVLDLQTPFDIQVGDTFDMTPGCDRLFQGSCKAKFNNGLNHGGIPDIPGADQMVYPK